MTVSRRQFMRAGSVFAVAAGLSLGFADLAVGQKKRRPNAPSTDTIIPYQAQRDALFHMTRETFSQYVNTTFVIDPGYTFPIETRLVEVKDLRSIADQKRNTPGKECFSILFQPVGEESLVKQSTYRIRHDALGTFDLFVVPMHDKQGRLFYEAIINRLVP